MENVNLPATTLTPAILFDYAQHRLSMKGESYPENVATFYGPLLASLQAYLGAAAQARTNVSVDVALTYVNSASTKSLQHFFSMLDAAGKAGAVINIRWFVDPDDEALSELGADLLEGKLWLQHEISHYAG